MRILAVLLFCAVTVWSGVAAAQSSPNGLGMEVIESAVAQADRIEASMGRGPMSETAIEEARAGLETDRRTLALIATEIEARLTPLETQLELLGPVPEEGEEPEGIAQQRSRLNEEIATLRTVARRAEQGSARASALLDGLNEMRISRLREQLLQRGPSPVSGERLQSAWDEGARVVSRIRIEVLTRMAVDDAMRSLLDRLALPVLIALVALFLGFVLRRWVVGRLTVGLTPETPRSRQVALAAGITFARLLLPAAGAVLIGVGLMNSGLVGPTGQVFLEAGIEGALVFVAAFALGNAYFAPDNGAIRLSSLDDAAARRAYRWMIGLALVVALDRTFIHAGQDGRAGTNVLAAVNAALLVVGGLMLWRFVRVTRLGVNVVEAGPSDDPADDDDATTQPTQPIEIALRIAQLALRASAILAPLLAIAGYYGASRFVFYPAVFSGALIALCVLIYHVMREVSFVFQRQTPEAQAAPQVGVIPVLTGFVLSLGALPLLALIWGATVTDLQAGWSRLVDGFRVGETVISPLDFLLFAVVFVVGYMATRALQGVVRRTVLPLTKFDDGAKSAMVAGLGYIGIAIAALIAISTTGLDLSNLAIVAGALSVGIGFGLQNIVNNFVSGIILLIERPIKVGDWVEVGGVHGTVQRVNVRSTEIQTFDRSSMFVPNADLISGTVTNWTHSNNHGRIIVAVGVAYGSDVRHVQKVLQEVAEDHAMLMRRPAPYVVFMGFGADSLDFEIRGVLRDVNWILHVGSDLRFAVYERFMAEGIEIPFAQRDIHIRNVGELGAAFGSKPNGAAVRRTGSGEDSRPPKPPAGEGPDSDGPDNDGDVR
ncbi:MAG: DUF3772 domain-containing protein [Pseudomonadota bacterium]